MRRSDEKHGERRKETELETSLHFIQQETLALAGLKVKFFRAIAQVEELSL